MYVFQLKIYIEQESSLILWVHSNGLLRSELPYSSNIAAIFPNTSFVASGVGTQHCAVSISLSRKSFPPLIKWKLSTVSVINTIFYILVQGVLKNALLRVLAPKIKNKMA